MYGLCAQQDACRLGGPCAGVQNKQTCSELSSKASEDTRGSWSKSLSNLCLRLEIMEKKNQKKPNQPTTNLHLHQLSQLPCSFQLGKRCPNVFLFLHYHSDDTESEQQQLHCCFPAIFSEIAFLHFSSHALVLYIQSQIILVLDANI